MQSKTIVIVFIVIIVIVGIILAMRSFFKSKKEESLGTLLITSGLGLVMSSTDGLTDKIFLAIGVIAQSEHVEMLQGKFNYFYFFTGIILLFIGVFMKIYVKSKLYILNINAYIPKKIESYFNDLKLSNFQFKEREIDVIKLYKKIFNPTLDEYSLKCILEELEEKVKAFANEGKDFKKGYTGIAPFPLVMYAGTFLERTKINEYYEFDKIGTETYYKLDNDKKKLFSKIKYPKLTLKTDINLLDKKAKEIVIAISITQPILDEELIQFNCNIPTVHLSVDSPKDNTIRYKEQLTEYNNFIINMLEDLGKKIPALEKIHLVYSGQSCLALEMGKRTVDNTRLCQIICYQYERQNGNVTSVRYPWGLIINSDKKSQFIKV